MFVTMLDWNQSCNPSPARGYTTEDGACVDIKAPGFSENDRQCAFLILGCAHAYHSLPPSTCYRRHEQEKKVAYDQCFREVEYGCFLPLVLSACGGGPTAKMAYKKLASVVATKHKQSNRWKWRSMCRDDDAGCHRGIGAALAQVSFGLVEESTHAYFTILFWEISSRLL